MSLRPKKIWQFLQILYEKIYLIYYHLLMHMRRELMTYSRLYINILANQGSAER